MEVMLRGNSPELIDGLAYDLILECHCLFAHAYLRGGMWIPRVGTRENSAQNRTRLL